MNTPDRVISTRHITESTQITSPEPRNPLSTHKHAAPESLQYERPLYPGRPTHQNLTTSTHTTPDRTPAPHEKHIARSYPCRTQQHANLRTALNSTQAVMLHAHAGAGKALAPHGPRAEREPQACCTSLHPALTASTRPDRPTDRNPTLEQHLTEGALRSFPAPNPIRSAHRTMRKSSNTSTKRGATAPKKLPFDEGEKAEAETHIETAETGAPNPVERHVIVPETPAAETTDEALLKQGTADASATVVGEAEVAKAASAPAATGAEPIAASTV